MELVFLLLLIVLVVVSFWTVTAITVVITWAYLRTYYDGAEHSGKRMWPWFRRTCYCIPCLRRMYRYDGPPLQEKGVLYAVHPHGMMALGAGMALLGGETAIRVAMHGWLFAIPIVRELLLWVGSIEVDALDVGVMLARGHTTALVPGGVREHDNDTQRPRGFLEWNYTCWQRPVVPVWCPQELATFYVWKPSLLGSLRAWGMRVLRYPVGTLFWPRWPTHRFTVHRGRAIDPKQYGALDTFVDAYWAELDRVKTEAAHGAS